MEISRFIHFFAHMLLTCMRLQTAVISLRLLDRIDAPISELPDTAAMSKPCRGPTMRTPVALLH